MSLPNIRFSFSVDAVRNYRSLETRRNCGTPSVQSTPGLFRR